MKGLLRAGCVFLVLVGLAGAGRLWSGDKPAPPAPRCRIGMINLTYVVSNYDKYKNYKDQMKTQAKEYEDRLKALQSQMESLTTELKDAPADKRDEITKKQISAQVLAETLKREGQATLGKKMNEFMVEIYKELTAASERYAKAHDIELVVQYNEPLQESEFFSAENVGRKMSAGAFLPLYAAPGLDVTKEVLALLQEGQKKD